MLVYVEWKVTVKIQIACTVKLHQVFKFSNDAHTPKEQHGSSGDGTMAIFIIILVY